MCAKSEKALKISACEQDEIFAKRDPQICSEALLSVESVVTFIQIVYGNFVKNALLINRSKYDKISYRIF